MTQDAIVAALGAGATLYDQTFHVEGVDQTGPSSPAATTQPKGVDIYIFVSGNAISTFFDAQGVQKKINGMLGPALKPYLKANESVTVHVSVGSKLPKTVDGKLGWQDCGDNPKYWAGWVYYDQTMGYQAHTTAGQAVTRVNWAQEENYAAGGPVNWDQDFANILAHEQLNEGINGGYDGGNSGDITSTHENLVAPAVFPAQWCKDFVANCGL